ncbi:MAG: hypothetical protein FJZ10_02770 [Candidatus Omnitrophica bacterium]|nr:hypothetical protein [Candidatus Omnitrophota bacterium]
MLCKKHSETDTLYYCMGCGGYFCQECVDVHEGSVSLPYTCRACGGKCERMVREESSLEAAQSEASGAREIEPPTTATSFWQEFIPSFAYPFRNKGALLLLVGSVFFAVFFFIARTASLFGLPLLLILISYLLEYMLTVLEASAYGSDQPPEFPAISDWTEMVFGPLFLIILAAAFCYAPAIVYLLKMQSIDSIFWLLLFLGQFFYPMMFLIIAMTGKFVALNPFVIISSILKAPTQYIVIVAMFFAISYLRNISQVFLNKIPFLGFFIGEFIAFYFLIVQMRLMGVYYRCNEESFSGIPNARRAQ